MIGKVYIDDKPATIGELMLLLAHKESSHQIKKLQLYAVDSRIYKIAYYTENDTLVSTPEEVIRQ
jgi:hypothetical protein